MNLSLRFCLFSAESTITQAQKPNITHLLTQEQKPTHTYELAKKPTHEDEKIALILFLTGGFTTWFAFRQMAACCIKSHAILDIVYVPIKLSPQHSKSHTTPDV